MASKIESVFSVQWPEYGNDCYIEPIVLFETKQLFRRPQQQSTHGLHIDSSLDWLTMEHIIHAGKICGLVLVCRPPLRIRRASFAIRVQRLAIPEAKAKAGLTVNGKQKDVDVTFQREGQTIVIAHFKDDGFSFPPLAILNSMSSVLAFDGWDGIPD